MVVSLTPDRLQELRRIAAEITPGTYEWRIIETALALLDDIIETALALLDENECLAERVRELEGALDDPATLERVAEAVHDAGKEVERLRWERGTTRYLLDSSEYNTWACEADDCNALWYLEDGTPSENRMRYCPGCGRRIVAEVRDVEEQEWEG